MLIQITFKSGAQTTINFPAEQAAYLVNAVGTSRIIRFGYTVVIMDEVVGVAPVLTPDEIEFHLNHKSDEVAGTGVFSAN